MRPLKLTLEGFTSFRCRQILDFSTLDLFAITGATGAGKSSLLDAITFALYGKVARLGKETRTSELVSQGATNLKVEFHFCVQQTEYKATRTWRYRPSSPETKFLLDKLRDGQWERCDRTQKVEDILRMDFDTFIRVILLPQGQFDEFLKGDATKRRKLLSDLAGFKIFERMSREASTRAKQYKDEREALERLLADILPPNEAEVSEKQEQLSNLEREIPLLASNATNAQKLLDDEERLLTQIKRLSELKQDLARLDEEAALIASLEQRLQQAEAANRLQGDWALVQEAQKQAGKAESAVKAADEHLTQAQAKLAIEQQKHEVAKIHQEEMKTHLSTRERNLAAAKAYEAQCQHYAAEVARSKKSIAQRSKNQKSAIEKLANAEARVKTARLRTQKAEKAISLSSPGGTRLEQLNQVTPLLANWKFIQDQTSKNRQKLEKTTQELLTADKIHQNKVLKLEQAEVALSSAQAAEHAAEVANTKACQKNHAAALRLTLHDGDSCPVCNNIYSEAQLLPLPAGSLVDLTPLQNQKALAEKKQKVAQTDLTKAEADRERLQQRELEHRQELATSERELSEIQQQISTVLHSDLWEADALIDERLMLQTQDAEYHQGLAEKKEAAAEVLVNEQAFQSAQNAHATALVESQAAIEEESRWQHQLQEVMSKLHEITGGQPYENLRQALQRDQQELERIREAVEESYQTAYRSAIQAEEANNQARAVAESTRAKREQLEAQWTAALQSAGFSETYFLKALASTTEQDSWKSAIADYKRRSVELSTRGNEVTSLIGVRTTDEGVLAQRREAKRCADEKVQQAHQQRTELSAWLLLAIGKQQQAEQLLTKQSTLLEQEQTYHTLSRNLRSDEFQSYILENLETDLVARATMLLRELTDSRYSLRIQDGEYWVEDNWNGGETRRVRTLSGGETFATSLAMALALSEKLSMGVELGSLFLDEGFGTLDAETLLSVTQILESLRQQDRLIGVITHVQALGEQLPTQVKVHKSPEGSRLVVEAL